MSEFNLSDKIDYGLDYKEFIHITDVKEFIRRLKEIIPRSLVLNNLNIIEEIDNLAGEDLK